jgi:hypothetical protein
MSIWRNKTFLVGLVIAPLFLVYGVWKLKSRFFDGPPPAAVVASPPAAAVAGAGARPGALVPAPGRAEGASVGIGKGIGGEDDAQASPWRVVGAVRFDKHDWAVLRRKGFALRYVPLSACVLSFGVPIECKLAGEVFMPDIKPTGETPPPAMAALANHLGNKP